MNPITVNSVNITAFGFKSTFQIADKQITFDLTGYTTFQSGGSSAIQGVYFKLIDPSGILLKDYDFTTPDINPAGSSCVVPIPSGLFVYGWWQIFGTIIDEDGTKTEVSITKNICEPQNISNGIIPGSFQTDLNCDSPSIKIGEITPLVYNNLAPILVTKDGTLYYPQGTLDPLAFTKTPMLVSGSTSVYAGNYIIKNTTTAVYDLSDGVFVELKYFTNLPFSVTCASALASIICCIEAVKDIYSQWPNTERGKAAKAQLDQVAPYMFIALTNEKIGLPADKEVKQIVDILGCDCNCGAQQIEPRTIAATQNIVIAADCGIGVDAVTEGNTTTYTLTGSISQVVKADAGDLGFDIAKTSSGCTDTYQISFNYPVLAENLLETIQGDDNLITLFNNIVDKSLFSQELAGFNGMCLVDLTKVDYTLAVPIRSGATQIVLGITIDSVIHNAPGGLSLLNASGFATWLNSLALGTFTVVRDDTAETVTIGSLQNTHKVATMDVQLTLSGQQPTIKTYLFSSNTKSLVQLLQILFTFCCQLKAANVAFGVDGVQQYSFNNDFSAINKTTLSRATTLDAVITGIITAQQQLFNRVLNFGLTCANMKAQFGASTKVVNVNDVLFGTKGGDCAGIPWAEVASIILQQISSSTDLQSLLCGVSQGCAGAVCAPVTNLSAVFTAGTIIVNANDPNNPTAPIQIRYRIAGSGLSFTTVTGTAADLPKTVGSSLVAAQYEVQLRQQCSNGVFSPWIAVMTNNACAVPLAVSITQNGSNFTVAGTLSGSQTIIEVLMTDPNGSQSTFVNDFTAVSGSFNIPIPSGLTGTYTFQVRAVCNNTSSPRFVSAFLPPSSVTVGTGRVDNVYAYAGYGMTITNIVNNTSTGIPASFTGQVITHSASDYAATIGAGTIDVTLTGTPALTIKLKLVKNGSTVLDNLAISGAGTLTLTLPAAVSAPDILSIEVDQP